MGVGHRWCQMHLGKYKCRCLIEVDVLIRSVSELTTPFTHFLQSPTYQASFNRSTGGRDASHKLDAGQLKVSVVTFLYFMLIDNMACERKSFVEEAYDCDEHSFRVSFEAFELDVDCTA